MIFRLFSNYFLPFLLLLSALLFFQSVREHYILKVDLVSEKDGEIEVFWTDEDSAFAATKSKKHALSGGRNRVSFNIAAKDLKYLRIDPSSDTSISVISSIKVSQGFYTKNWSGDSLSKFKAHTPGTITKIQDGKLNVSNPSADPGIITPRIEIADTTFRLSVVLLSLSLLGLILCNSPDHNSAWIDKLTARKVVVSAFSIFLFMMLFRLHGSSIDSWQEHLHGTEQSTVFGSAKNVRSDEWLVSTTAILSQVNQSPAMSPQNPSLSIADGPLIYGLPVTHFSLLFRPAHWGFYLFDIERGFSFAWNLRLLCCFLGIFLFLNILSDGKTLQSLALALMFFYSAFMQWWQSTLLPEMLGAACLSAYFLICSLRSETHLRKIVFSLLSCLFACNFITALYPPFQVPIGWAVLMALVAVWSKSKFSLTRSVVLNMATIASLSALLLIPYFYDIAESIRLLGNTAYPGKRSLSGAELSFWEIFRGFTSPLWNEDKFPAGYGNICEASSFIFLFPLFFSQMLLNISWARQNKFLTPMVFYIIALIIYMTAGVPQWLAGATGFSFVSSNRATIGLGLADIFLCALFIGSMRKPAGYTAMPAIAIWITLNLLASQENLLTTTPGTISFIFLLLCVAAGFSLLGRTFRASPLIALSFAAHVLVNPVAQGLSPIINSKEFEFAGKIERLSPDSRVLVLEDVIFSRILAAAGVNVISGARLIPDLEMYRKIDPDGKDSAVYNRFAHTSFGVGSEVDFEIYNPDRIDVTLAGCSSIHALGVQLMIVPEHMDIALIRECTEELQQPLLIGWKLLKVIP